MYMDSSGANNIGCAQVLDDAIVRSKWIDTPVYTDPTLRVNLDGFPIAMFWCKSSENKGGVVQNETAANVYDTNGTTHLFDSVRPNADNPNIGEVTPLNPVYIGTYNFNYDKKAKKLLGWPEDVFQGFEFRGNSSNCNLYQGFENMCAFCSTSEGFEWRWTYNSDWIDDYHDGNLSLTIDGGYFDGDVAQKYDEAAYLANRSSITYLQPFNQFYVMKNGEKAQLFHEIEDPETHELSYEPINYGSIDARNLGWNITNCEGISKPDLGICLECGMKTGTKDSADSLLWQFPYGVDVAHPLGSEYPDGSHYYKFSWNPEHEFKYEYNDTQEYFTNNDNWTALYPLSEVKALEIHYTQDDDGLYYLDASVAKDGMYHLIANYLEEEQAAILEDVTHRYNRTAEYVAVTTSDTVYTHDFMREIFKNWCYVNEAVAHCDENNWKSVFDSRLTWGNNGHGLFVYDSLTNYYGSSVFAGLCDNFAKNVFMHSYDNGLTWSPAWYDMDTSFGLNNEGAYTKMYDIDFMDLDTTGARAFNGSNSRIWTLLYNNAMADIKSMYQELRANNYISYDKLVQRLITDNIDYKAASLFNTNAVYRYMEPLAWHSNTKPEAAQGSREQLIKYWSSNRQTFLDSRYEGNGWTTDTIVMRLNNTQTVSFNLIPDTNMFLGANFNSGQATVPSVKSATKVEAGQTWTCSYGPSTNLNTYIYGASHLLEVGDLSLCNSTEYSIATATNLRKLKIGDKVHPPVVTTRLNLSTGAPYANLKEIDLTNTNFVNTNLSFVMTLNNANLMPALETLKLKGSNIEYLTLAPYTPLQYLSLPNTIRVINLVNEIVLRDLVIYGHSALESISIENCPQLDQLSILNTLYGDAINISMDNIAGTDETRVSIAFMDWLKDCNATLQGTIYVESIADEDLDVYRAKWPNLDVEWHQIIATDVIFGTTNEGGLHE